MKEWIKDNINFVMNIISVVFIINLGHGIGEIFLFVLVMNIVYGFSEGLLIHYSKSKDIM